MALLRHAVGEGRLDMEEFTDRTHARLPGQDARRAARADRRHPARAARAAAAARAPAEAPGRAGFTARWLAPARRRKPRPTCWSSSPRRCARTATRSRCNPRPTWSSPQAPPCVDVRASPSLLFPVGLIALLHTDRDEIVFELARARRRDADQRERPGAARDQARAERTRALTISHAGGNHAVNSVLAGAGDPLVELVERHEPPLHDLVRVGRGVDGDLGHEQVVELVLHQVGELRAVAQDPDLFERVRFDAELLREAPARRRPRWSRRAAGARTRSSSTARGSGTCPARAAAAAARRQR